MDPARAKSTGRYRFPEREVFADDRAEKPREDTETLAGVAFTEEFPFEGTGVRSDFLSKVGLELPEKIPRAGVY